MDDGLEQNLESFAALEWPDLEVLLGVRSAGDTAWPLATAMALRHPGRFRVVVQRGEPGHNPKVNQLVSLAGAARHDLLVVSDSNVRVGPEYLYEIAALLEDPEIGLVTHAIAGAGELRLGSLFDHLHLSGYVSPGVVAAKCLLGADIVVGKSMAFRREDLEALGGFEAVKDVLAEDYVLGRMVSRRLGKRVAVARRPIVNVSQRRGLSDFTGRYTRWSVLHRTTTGRSVHLLQATLNPVLLGAVALLADPGVTTSVGARRHLRRQDPRRRCLRPAAPPGRVQELAAPAGAGEGPGLRLVLGLGPDPQPRPLARTTHPGPGRHPHRRRGIGRRDASRGS